MGDLVGASRQARSAILIVEDHDRVRNNLCDWLSELFAGSRCLLAKSGEEALDLAVAQQPTVVLMDIQLPQLDGIETTRRLKRLLPRARVVILSIHEEEQYRVEAAAAGASAYVSKRHMNRDLPATIARLLG